MRRVLILAFVLLVPATSALAQGSGDRYTRYGGRRDRFYLNVGGVFLRHDTTDQLSARGFDLGTKVDWEDVFGLPESTSSFRVEGFIKVFPRHRFRVGYFKTRRSGTQQLIEEDLQWGELAIPIDVSVDSQWDTRVIRADYRFSLIHKDRVDLGINLGVYLLRVQSSLAINETSVNARTEDSVPLPLIGADIEWSFAEDFVVRTGVQLLGVKIGDQTTVDGEWIEFRGAVEWLPLRNVGLGVGYLYNDVDLDIEFGGGALQQWVYNYNTGGLKVYAFAAF